jgi:LTXXQ motif family protein
MDIQNDKPEPVKKAGSSRKTWFLAAGAIVAAGAILAVGAGVSFADWGRHGPRMGEGMGGGGHHRGARIERLCERDPIRFEGVARAFIKADLDLNAAQNGELDKLAGTLIPSLKELRDVVCSNFAERAATTTSPERLERLAAVLKKAAETAEKAVAPSKAFYATLDDKQKAKIDEMTNRRHPGMHRGQPPAATPPARP